MTFNAPPNWPQPPAGWNPPPGWTPPAEWGPAPEGWDFGTDEKAPLSDPAYATPGYSAPAYGVAPMPGSYAQAGHPQAHAYAPYPGQYAPQNLRTMPGWGHKNNALVLGILGLVFSFSLIGPFIFGGFGLVQANKAESLGVPATGGKTLAIINLIVGILVVLWLFEAASM